MKTETRSHRSRRPAFDSRLPGRAGQYMASMGSCCMANAPRHKRICDRSHFFESNGSSEQHIHYSPRQLETSACDPCTAATIDLGVYQVRSTQKMIW